MSPRSIDEALEAARFAEMSTDPQRAVSSLATAVRVLVAEIKRIQEELELLKDRANNGDTPGDDLGDFA